MAASAATPLHIGKVTLTVHDLERVSDYYQQIVGLHRQSADGEHVVLGAGGRTLLELNRDPHARVRSFHDPGLFHTAFLLPYRGALGQWIRRAADLHLHVLGASDHRVSEAIYLSDPEGNGIEIYVDRPPGEWKWEDGQVDMPTLELDLHDLIASAAGNPWQAAPEGTSIGHVHLQVGAIPPAEAFYNGILGLDITCRYPGGTFFASGGYHHHIATNIWNSRNAAPRSVQSTGLADVEILAASPSLIDAVGDRAEDAGLIVERSNGTLRINDPWNTPLTLTTAAR